MRTRSAVIAVAASLIVAAFFASSAAAQNYRFSVPKLRVALTVREDASVLIEYRFEFENARGAHPIDVVDVGMPKKGYTVIGARVDGKPLRNWRRSRYIEIGPEVHLGRHAIPAGRSGVFEVKARVPDMVYSDTTDDALASLRFTPTWFGKQYVMGKTNLLLVVKFPDGVDPNGVVWHDDRKPFFQKGILDPDGVPFVSWKDTYSLTGPNMFGCSFPRAVMDRVVKTNAWMLLVQWWEASPNVQLGSGILWIVLFMVFFLMMTRGTGWALALILAGIMAVLFYMHPLLHLCAWPAMPLWVALWYLGFHRRKRSYLPAMATVEGGQIRRGLAPPEAAVLTEQPLDRVLSMVIFGMLRKGVASIVAEDPFTVQAEGEQAGDAPNLIKLGGGRQVTIHLYEVLFWERLRGAQQPVSQINFDKELRALITLVRSKMTGFDVDRTREYYRRIVERAWRQVSAAVNVERKNDLADRHFGWLQMAGDSGERWTREYDRGWHYTPRWWYGGAGRPAPTGPVAPAAPSPPSGAPSFKDVAASFAGRIENAGAACVSAVDGFHQRTGIGAGGIDLSAVDRFTLETLESLGKSGGRGGGGFGGCACAGCACACACAGGGR